MNEPKPPTVISYGGGVQSTAMVVLAAQGKLGYDVDAALFSNVGDDSEHPATLDYVRNVAMPWAKDHGVVIHELLPVTRDGSTKTLWRLLHEENTPSIPVRLGGGPPANRSCTRQFKVDVVGKWLKANGASKDNPATVCIGISTDEIQRVSSKRKQQYERPVWPLIDLGMNRSDCLSVIRQAGLPIPPKSSCFFCPFKTPRQWAEMRRDSPDLFDKAVGLEEHLNKRRAERGKDSVFLTDLGMPLSVAVGEAQDMLPGFSPDMPTCDEGYCWT